MLDINLCIKPGLSTFSPPPRQVYLFKVTVYVHLGGGKRREYAELLGQIQNGVLSLEAWWFFDSKPDQNIPLWSQKWKGNMLQNIRLQRNGRLSPKSDDNMNDSCVKTQTPRIWSELKLTANRLVKRWFYLVPPTTTKTSKRSVFWMQITDYGPLETFGNKVVVGLVLILVNREEPS